MRKTKGFSYDPETDKDVMEHIDKQQNGSQYVWDLVRRDIKENDIEEVIRRQIEKYLQGLELTAGYKKDSVDIDESELKNIMNL